MNEEKRRILDMLAEGKLSSEDAMTLIDQLGETAEPVQPVYRPDAPQAETDGKKMLRVRVIAQEAGKEKPTVVNMNLPLKVARVAGRLITTMMPQSARDTMQEQGINIADLDFDGLIDALEDTGGDIINVTHEEEGQNVLVRVYVG